MADHLLGPDGLRVEPVRLDDAHLAVARAHRPDARHGESWFMLTRGGRLIAYLRDVEELAGHVDLADLRGPGADEQTA